MEQHLERHAAPHQAPHTPVEPATFLHLGELSMPERLALKRLGDYAFTYETPADIKQAIDERFGNYPHIQKIMYKMLDQQPGTCRGILAFYQSPSPDQDTLRAIAANLQVSNNEIYLQGLHDFKTIIRNVDQIEYLKADLN